MLARWIASGTLDPLRLVDRRKRIVAIRMFAASAGAFGVLWWITYPRSARLYPYDSPPIKLTNGTIRVKLLVPSGWTVRVHSPAVHSIAFARPLESVILDATQPRRWPWMPQLFRRMLVGPEEPTAALFVSTERGMNEDEETLVQKAAQNGNRAFLASRSASAARGYSIYYLRSDESAFEETFRPICDSVQVVYQPQEP